MNLNAVELKAYVPARDFNLSLRFYEALGFEKKYADADIAYFAYGDHISFLLQNFYRPELADHFVLHLLVENLADWHHHLSQLDLKSAFNTELSAISQKPWGMLECHLLDPSGVLLRLGQNLPQQHDQDQNGLN